LCIRYSRGISKAGKNPRDVCSLFSKFAIGIGDIRAEINALFKNFKVNFISSLNAKLDALQVHKNQEFDEVFCPDDRKEHTIDGCSYLIWKWHIKEMRKLQQSQNHGNHGLQVWFKTLLLYFITCIIHYGMLMC